MLFFLLCKYDTFLSPGATGSMTNVSFLYRMHIPGEHSPNLQLYRFGDLCSYNSKVNASFQLVARP